MASFLFPWRTWAIFCVFIMVSANSYSTEHCPVNTRGSRFREVFKGVCYQFVVNRWRSFSDAKAECRLQGGSLAIVKTAGVNHFLTNQMKNVYKINKEMWIGLYENGHQWSKYTWVDRSLAVYSPDNFLQNAKRFKKPNVPDCVALDPNKNGSWTHNQCYYSGITRLDHDLKPYICQHDTVLLNTSSTTIINTGGHASSDPKPYISTTQNLKPVKTKTIDRMFTTTRARLALETSTASTTKPPSKQTKTSKSSTSTTRKDPTETTQSKPTCPPFVCEISCGMDGYMEDSNGCSICKCYT